MYFKLCYIVTTYDDYDEVVRPHCKVYNNTGSVSSILLNTVNVHDAREICLPIII